MHIKQFKVIKVCSRQRQMPETIFRGWRVGARNRLQEQVDQIGRMFADGAIYFFGQFFNCNSSPKVWATCYHGRSYTLILGWATFWATFSQIHLVNSRRTSETKWRKLGQMFFCVDAAVFAPK
jgi:hypothetical protein